MGDAAAISTGIASELGATSISGIWKVYKFTPASTWSDTGTSDDRFILWTTNNGYIEWDQTSIQIVPAEVATDTYESGYAPAWATCYADDAASKAGECWWTDSGSTERQLTWTDFDDAGIASKYRLAPGSDKAVLIKKPS